MSICYDKKAPGEIGEEIGNLIKYVFGEKNNISMTKS
jgi:hypothetical protein